MNELIKWAVSLMSEVLGFEASMPRNPEEAAIVNEAAANFADCVRKIKSQRDRFAFLLAWHYTFNRSELGYKDMALLLSLRERAKITENNFKQRIFRAKLLIERCLREKYGRARP